MSDPELAALFAGDLDDPWVGAIADALPKGSERWHCPDQLPEDLRRTGGPARTLVVHRARLDAADLERVGRWRRWSHPEGRVVLCVGPHARQVDLERWAGGVDVIVPEATARETIGRHLIRPGRVPLPSGRRGLVEVVSGNFALREALTLGVRSLGYAAEACAGWSTAKGRGVAVWDVPALEPDWTVELRRRALRRAVVALVGFADRGTVELVRAVGAAACLELPCDLDDLAFVLDRLLAPTLVFDPAHPVPLGPKGVRLGRRAVADPGSRA